MNEIPYPPPQRVQEAAQKSLSRLNRYTSPKDLDLLRERIADYSNVAKKHIFVSAGSELLLREIIHSFSMGRKVIMVYPSFFPISQCAKKFITKLVRIQLQPPAFTLNYQIIANEIKNDPVLIIIDNPNNPTGKILLDKKMVKNILQNKNVLLVIDEAYYEFSNVSFADMVESHPNLAVVRTLDKVFGLAGARIGYLIAGNTFLDAFSTFFMYLPQSTLYSALEVMKDFGYIKENIERITTERNRMIQKLEALKIQVFPSVTNFLLMKTNYYHIVEKLEKQGVLVSDISNYWLPGYFRVSIGTPKENDIFLDTLEDILKIEMKKM